MHNLTRRLAYFFPRKPENPVGEYLALALLVALCVAVLALLGAVAHGVLQGAAAVVAS